MTTTDTQAVAPPMTGYHHMGLTVRDVEVSEAWYGTVLSLVRAFVEPHRDGDGYAVVMTRPGAPFFLGLDHHVDADRQRFSARRTGLDHLAIGVATRAEFDGWVAHLDSLGVEHGEIFESTEPMCLALMTFRDPDGIELELIWQES